MNVRTSPEEEELGRKKAEFAELQRLLSDQELELATLQGELHAFELEYQRVVGLRYAELDELEHRLAAHRVKNDKGNAELEREEQLAGARADSSRRATRETEAIPDTGRSAFRPPPEMKQFYRDLAKQFHPDLASSPQDRLRRETIMAGINDVYYSGDFEKLKRFASEIQYHPDAVLGEDVGSKLVRTIRMIVLVRRRLESIEAEIKALQETDLCRLKHSADAATSEGRDLLMEMAKEIAHSIEAMLNTLQTEGAVVTRE